MKTRAPAGARPTGGEDRTGDRGISFVEVLIAVALLSMAVIGVLPALWTTVRGSGMQDRFASARKWVVGAGEYATSSALGRTPCYAATTAQIISSYQAAIRTAAAPNRPANWADTQLTVTDVQFWSGTAFSAACVETASLPLKLQKISLRVVDNKGDIFETLDVVKADG